MHGLNSRLDTAKARSLNNIQTLAQRKILKHRKFRSKRMEKDFFSLNTNNNNNKTKQNQKTVTLSQRERKSIDENSEMTQILKLSDKKIKEAITTAE